MSAENHEPAAADRLDGENPGNLPAGAVTRRRPIWPFIVLLLLIPTAIWGHRTYQSVKTHASTDDSYLTSDITQIAPQVSGTITQVFVHENDMVKPGQLLVTLDESSYRAAAEQARANLAAAIAQGQGANVNVTLAQETGQAQVEQARGGVEQAQCSIGGAQAQVAASEATVARSSATTQEAQANIATAEAGVAAAQANRSQAQAMVEAAATQVTNAKAAVRAAEAGITAAAASANSAASDVKRYQSLVAQSAISRQVYDHAVAAADSAQAQLDAARQQTEMAREQVNARTSELEAARQRLSATDAAVNSAQAQVAAAREHASAVSTDINSAKAGRQVAQQGVKQAQARHVQAVGQLAQANTAPHQVAVSSSNAAQAQAKIMQAQAALHDALLRLGYCRIYAPAAGQVSKKNAEVGALVQPGTPLMALVQNNGLWVVANYKETQLARMRPGQTAEIEVDALHGETFTGRVNSISAATGATFALLPPENASGNFTKIVQRVPVKIVLDAGQRDLDRLRAGMSVKAVINLASAGLR